MIVANPLAPLPGITTPLREEGQAARARPGDPHRESHDLAAAAVLRPHRDRDAAASCCSWPSPLLRMLYYLVLVETGLGSVAYDQIALRAAEPAGRPHLAGARPASPCWPCSASSRPCSSWPPIIRPATRRRSGWCCGRSGGRCASCCTPQGVLIVVYLLLLLPLAHFGLSSTLTKQIGVPPFVSEELFKSATTSWLYVGFLLVLAYVNLRLILTLPLLATTSATRVAGLRHQLAADPLAQPAHRRHGDLAVPDGAAARSRCCSCVTLVPTVVTDFNSTRTCRRSPRRSGWPPGRSASS